MDHAGLTPPEQLPLSVVVATPPMPRRKGLRVGIVAALVLLALGIGSFVWASSSDETRFSWTASADATETIETLRFEMEVQVGGQRVPISGIMDVKGQLMEIDVDGSSLFTGHDITSVSAIVDLKGVVMYIDAQAVGQPLPQGKTWVRLDLRTLADQFDVKVSDLTIGTSTNPLDVTRLVTTAAASTDLGRETILEGVEAEHFQFDVSVDDAFKAAGTSRDQLDASGGAELPDTLVLDAWVDADNLVRQIEFSIDVLGTSVGYAVRYTEINPVVNITLPTRAESMDLFDLLIGG